MTSWSKTELWETCLFSSVFSKWSRGSLSLRCFKDPEEPQVTSDGECNSLKESPRRTLNGSSTKKSWMDVLRWWPSAELSHNLSFTTLVSHTSTKFALYLDLHRESVPCVGLGRKEPASSLFGANADRVPCFRALHNVTKAKYFLYF